MQMDIVAIVKKMIITIFVLLMRANPNLTISLLIMRVEVLHLSTSSRVVSWVFAF